LVLGQEPSKPAHRRSNALRPEVAAAGPVEALEIVFFVVLGYLELAAIFRVELVEAVERRVEGEGVTPGALRRLARRFHVHRPPVGEQMREHEEVAGQAERGRQD
jgi:hypothetical protein